MLSSLHFNHYFVWRHRVTSFYVYGELLLEMYCVTLGQYVTGYVGITYCMTGFMYYVTGFMYCMTLGQYGTGYVSIIGLLNVKLMITYGGNWVDDTYKGGETRVRGVGSDLSFLGLVKLLEEVVGVNSHNNEIKLHASFSHAVGVSQAVIRDDGDVASIMRDEKAVVVFVTVKTRNANDIPHEHMGPLSFANDTVMDVSDDDSSDQIEYDVEEDDTVDWNYELHDECEDDYVGRHDDCSEDERGEHTDISDCNHADGSIGHATTVVLEEFQFDDHARTTELEDVEGVDLIYENAIALENNIRSPDDSDQEREKACKFALRAMKLPEGEYWQLQMFQKVHMCIVDGLQCGYRTASARLIGELISTKVQGNYVTLLRLKEIMEKMKRKWGLQCLYGLSIHNKRILDFQRRDSDECTATECRDTYQNMDTSLEDTFPSYWLPRDLKT
ncbi:Uncharacterized protein TCM_003396 [Theobroma cacao]|uniref:Uncharacterized protein n=1 Tax=Theobroma cacao TaxID=3641 RepID=A0A061DN80_THECC|nr:Uncharacterized protein TCM_003396 [Theobroma cacao]